MTYEEARSFIEEANQYGSKLGLETITELLSRLGNPQEKLKIIHVAGTNGKGSTTAFLAAVLAAAGYRVGRYISPSVFSYREIIQISQQATQYQTEYISRQGVSTAIDLLQKVCKAMVEEGLYHPTSFEIETAMAFLYFLEQKVDFAVIEVGLGGRLDATNVLRSPICSVITSISLDHMQYLGNTLSKIAVEKAGIIKEGVPVITCNQKSEVLEVLSRVSQEKSARLTIADAGEAVLIAYSPEGTSFQYRREEYEIKLLGIHQIKNAVLAIGIAEVLEKLGYPIRLRAIKQGLRQTSWSGRLEVIARNPYVIIDGAHNEDAAKRLVESINLYFSGRRVLFLMGIFADKDYQRVLELTAPLAEMIITLTPNNSRGLSSEVLAKEAQKYCPKVFDAKTIRQAVQLAYEKASPEDVILAFGSLSFLKELKEEVTWQEPGHPNQED